MIDSRGHSGPELVLGDETLRARPSASEVEEWHSERPLHAGNARSTLQAGIFTNGTCSYQKKNEAVAGSCCTRPVGGRRNHGF
jgi:hypothetical protein